MSYVRTLDSSVTWHASGSVSYPASERGGSVSYSDSGTIPIKVNVFVDTEPFDKSVLTCNLGVTGLTSAVVSTKQAQCDNIKKQSLAISSTITKGFFNIIKSELSQDMTSLFNTLSSTILLIKQLATRILAQKSTMSSDYNRIYSRYSKVFKDLDSECYKRVYAIDKEAYNLSSNIQEKQISKNESNFSSTFFTNSSTLSLLFPSIILSNLKNRSKAAMQKIATYLNQKNIYENKVKGVLLKTPNKVSTTYFVPALYIQTSSPKDVNFENSNTNSKEDSTEEDSIKDKVYIASPLSSSVQEEQLLSYFTKNAKWQKENIKHKKLVDTEFNALMENYIKEESSKEEHKKRVLALIAKLKENDYLTIK